MNFQLDCPGKMYFALSFLKEMPPFCLLELILLSLLGYPKPWNNLQTFLQDYIIQEYKHSLVLFDL